jgi:RNase H-fold protein (predicted Holliday junction resolvase)
MLYPRTGRISPVVSLALLALCVSYLGNVAPYGPRHHRYYCAVRAIEAHGALGSSYRTGDATIFDPKRARLSIDYGPRLIGVATSDYFGCVQPRSTLQHTGNLTEVSCAIIDLAKSVGATECILGVPLDSNGLMSYRVMNFNGRLCLDFSKVLSAVSQALYPRMRVILVDERYTTREAKQRLKSEKVKGEGTSMFV